MFLVPTFGKLFRPIQPIRLLGLFSTDAMKRDMKTLFLSNLPFNCDKEVLTQAVAQRIGHSFTLRIPVDKFSGISKGFGFIDLNDSSRVDSVISKLEGLEVDGREIPCKISEPRVFQPDESLPVSDLKGIFVGNIPFGVDAKEVKTLLTNALGSGSIEKITFPNGDTSKGFCHLYLVDESLVDEAREKLNGLILGGRLLHVDRARMNTAEPYRRQTWKDPSQSTHINQNTEVFISSFNTSVTKEMFENVLDELVGRGSWRKVRFMIDANGLSRGFGFVEFFDEATARDAVMSLNNLELSGRRLKAEIARQKSADNPQVRAVREVYLTNLASEMTELMLREMLDDMLGPGTYLSIRFNRDDEGKSKGFAFVEFPAKSVAYDAIAALNGLEVLGKRIVAAPNSIAKPGSLGADIVLEKKELFLFNLGYACTRDGLQDFLQDKLGDVEFHVRLVVDKVTSQPRGIGYATFSSEEEAMKAMEILRGVMFMGRELKLDIALQAPDMKKQARPPAEGSRGSSLGNRAFDRGGRGGYGGRGGRGARGHANQLTSHANESNEL